MSETTKMRAKSKTFAEKLRLKKLAADRHETKLHDIEVSKARKKAAPIARKMLKEIKKKMEIVALKGDTSIWDGLYGWDTRMPLQAAVGEWLLNYFEKEGFEAWPRGAYCEDDDQESPGSWHGNTLALDWSHSEDDDYEEQESHEVDPYERR